MGISFKTILECSQPILSKVFLLNPLRTLCPRFEKLLSVRERGAGLGGGGGGGGGAGSGRRVAANAAVATPPRSRAAAAPEEKVYSPAFLTSCNSYPPSLSPLPALSRLAPLPLLTPLTAPLI